MESLASYFSAHGGAFFGICVAIAVAPVEWDLPLGLVNGSSSSSALERRTTWKKFAQALILHCCQVHKALYGFVIDLDLLAIVCDMPLETGVAYFFTALPEVAIVGYFSAKHQGNVATAGMQILAKRPEDMMRGYPCGHGWNPRLGLRCVLPIDPIRVG